MSERGAGSGQPTRAPKATVGFLTDSTLCIGCKACEVACKEWNDVPSDGERFSGTSYDHTEALGASSWRHVQFLERESACENDAPALLEWQFHSDVCKHCEHAGCLEACPTGAIVRTEVGSVLVQDDICNGCGYCVVTCPFGVIDRRPSPLDGAGGAFKCTFCYDRQVVGLEPACAKACPTESIQFGLLDELHARAEQRLTTLRERGRHDMVLYDARDSGVGGIHALSLLPGDPSDWGQPLDPVVPTSLLPASWRAAFLASGLAFVLVLLAFLLAPGAPT